MIEGIEEYYEELGNAVVDALPDHWEQADVEGHFYPSHIDFFGEYTDSKTGMQRSFAVPRECQRTMRKLRQLFANSGKKVWGKARFVLHNDGKFNMEWDYEGVDENGDLVFDEEQSLAFARARHERLTKPAE